MEDVVIVLAREDAELVLRAIQVFLTALPTLPPRQDESLAENLDAALVHGVELRLVQSEDQSVRPRDRPTQAH